MPFKNQLSTIKEQPEKEYKFLNYSDIKNKTSLSLLNFLKSKKANQLLSKNDKNKIIEAINTTNELEKNITQLTVKITELEEQIALLENACQFVNRENNHLRTEADCLISQNNSLKQEVSLNSARDRVSAELQKLKLKTPTELSKENTDLNQKCEILNNKIQKLEIQNDENLKQSFNQQNVLRETQQTLENSLQKNKHLDSKINQLHTEHDKLKEEHLASKNELLMLEEKRKTLIKSTSDKEEKIIELKKIIGELSDKLKFYYDQVEQLEIAKNRLLNKQESANNLSKKLIENNNELEVLKHKLARSQKDYSHLKADYDNLKSGKENSELNQIQTELDMKKSFNPITSKTTMTHGGLTMPDTEHDLLNDRINPTKLKNSDLSLESLMDKNNFQSENSSSPPQFKSQDSIQSNDSNLTSSSGFHSSRSLNQEANKNLPIHFSDTDQSLSTPASPSFDSPPRLSTSNESQSEENLVFPSQVTRVENSSKTRSPVPEATIKNPNAEFLLSILRKIYFNHKLSANNPEKRTIFQLLTETEKSMFPLELQYTDSPADFYIGLQSKYPYIEAALKNYINEEAFKELRLMLRKKGLEPFNITLIEDNDFINLDCEVWLKKKLKLVTGQPINLMLGSKLQKNLDNQAKRQFFFTRLIEEAITLKSTHELKKELGKLYAFREKFFEKFFEKLAEIESKFSLYPKLINETDIDQFKTNLITSLPSSINDVTDTQVKILLEKVNHCLENRRNKWAYFTKTLIGEITDEILLDSANLFSSDEKKINTLVENTLSVLVKFHDLQAIKQKRKQWDVDIQWLFAFSQKIKLLNQSLLTRIAKLENMCDMKEADAPLESNTQINKKTPQSVYLPHHCRLISPNENNVTDYSFSVKSDAFYKQNAPEVSQKLTFEQTLSNKEKRIWSITRSDEKSLTYETYKSWKDARNTIKNRIGYGINAEKEMSFSQMIHAVNSFKESTICTLQLGKCSVAMEKKLRLFIMAYNELRKDSDPLLICNFNSTLKMQRSEIEIVKTEIKNKLKLQSHELDNVNKQLSQPIETPSVSRFW